MVHVLFEEASCESDRLDPSLLYHIVLGLNWDSGPIRLDTKSTYIRPESAGRGGKLLWTRPFGDQIISLARPLTITLGRSRLVGLGYDLASYVLDSFDDCVARPIVLLPLNHSLEAGLTIRLVLTIWGNPSTSRENNSAAPTERQSSDRLAEIENVSEGFAPVGPYLADQMDWLPGNTPSVATLVATGLASVVLNLESMLNFVNLRADVHPLVKGAWSLVKSVNEITRMQPNLDERIEGLIDAMDNGAKGAKEYPPLEGRRAWKDSVIRDILREIIKGANIVKVYCQKRPKKLSALKTVASDLAQEVDNCFHALLALRGKVAQAEQESLIEIGHASHLIKTSADNDVLKEILYAKDADRALRNGSRGCLIGTRTDLTDAARDWATGIIPKSDPVSYLNAFDPESPVLWLCGVAGVGKSSIAITVAKALEDMGLLGLMYSFEAANQATLNPTNLFSTIAHHLAQHNPRWKQRLIDIIRDTKPSSRATSSPKEQFENFFLAVLAHDKNQTIVQPTVIIIDAFDECGNIGSRSELLHILTHRAHEIPPGVRILITSRYEPDVGATLTAQPKKVSLLKMEHIPKKSTERDINAYVHNELKDVQGVDAAQFVPQLTKLALAAEELFQWASTACAFIRDEDDGDGMLGPEERLSQVLESNEGLDNLYRTVLDRYFGSSKLEMLGPLHALFGCLAHAREPLSLRSMASLTASLLPQPNRDLNTFHRIARKLTSLVMGTQDVETPLVALHTSFTDFLRDENRSQKYYVDPLKFCKRLATSCLSIMDKKLQFNICKVPTSLKSNAEIENIQKLIRDHIPNTLSYACRFWAYHLSCLGAWTESEELRESVIALLSNHVLEWLKVMSLTETFPLDSLGYLENAHKIPSHYPHLSKLVHETSQFAAFFSAPIMKSTAHIYLSALPFAPATSQMFHRLRAGFKRNVQVTSGKLVTWPTTRHILAGQGQDVNCVVFSPDGRLIASASSDGTIRLWDTSTGLVVGVLRGHSASVGSVVFSPNSTLIASGSRDRTVRIWDVEMRTAVGEPLRGHDNSVNAVVFSPDGILVASGSYDHTIRIWDVTTHASVGGPLRGHSDQVHSVAFSPNGKLIASGSRDNTVRIWDVRMHIAVGKPLEGHSSGVGSVTFSPDGVLLASGSDDSTIRIWDISTLITFGEPLKGHFSSVLSVTFLPNGMVLASSSFDRTVRIWDVTARTAVAEPLEGHSYSVASVAFSPDGTLIASGSEDTTIRVWDVAAHTAAGTPLLGRSHPVRSVAFSPDGTLVASGSYDSTIRVWDVSTCTAIGEPLEGHSDSVLSVAFSPDDGFIASGSSDGTIRIWDVATLTAIGGAVEGSL